MKSRILRNSLFVVLVLFAASVFINAAGFEPAVKAKEKFNELKEKFSGLKADKVKSGRVVFIRY